MLKLLHLTIVVPISVLISLTWTVTTAKGQDAACFKASSATERGVEMAVDRLASVEVAGAFRS